MKNKRDKTGIEDLTLGDKLSIFREGYTYTEYMAVGMLNAILLKEAQDKNIKHVIISIDSFSEFGITYIKSTLLNESLTFEPAITITQGYSK